MRRPRVKVIVPCYQYAGWLEGCVASALDQPGVDVRVLIVDDASPDNTPAVAERLMDRDSRVEYRRHAANSGLITTANEGLDWADDGDYTVLLSADDLLVTGSLQRATAVMAASSNIGMVYGRAPYAHVGRPLPSTGGRWRRTAAWPGQDWIRLRCRFAHNCISSPEVVVRTAVHRAAGRYDPECVHASDLNMWLRIAAISDVALIKGVPQAIYRIHSDSMLRSNRHPMLDLHERRAAFDSFFASCETLLKDAEDLRRMTGRALARHALWMASRAVDRGLTDGPNGLPIDNLIAFALEVYPDARRLQEWRGYRVRSMIGSGRSRWFFPFIVTGAAHRARYHARRIPGIDDGHLTSALRSRARQQTSAPLLNRTRSDQERASF
jgi:hypothetical protein